MEGRTAPPFIFQIYKMFTLTVLPERYPSKLQESVCIVHIERKYIRQEENTTPINFTSPPQHSELKHIVEDLLDPQVVRSLGSVRVIKH